MSIQVPAADGSSVHDARPRVEIDLDDEVDRWRWRCPNNHANWDPTNGGLWCQSCQRAGIDPHWHQLLDAKRRELVPWADVVLR